MSGYKPFPYKGFGGGLNLRDSVDVVSEDQAINALNVLFSTRGSVEQRSGYAKLTNIEGTNRYDSLSPFYKSDGTKQLLAGAGNQLEVISTAGVVVANSTLPTTNPHTFQRFGGPTAEHVYIANGADTVRRWTGAAFETPVYAGTTPTGRFLGLSVTDNRLVSARFSGSTAGNNPSTVRFSAEGDPLTWGATHYVDLTPGDGEEIMGVATWRDLVVVFKQTRFFVFYGNSPDDDGEPVFHYRPVDAGVGMAANGAKAVAEQGIYFLDRTGVYFTAGSQPARVSENVEGIFHGDTSVYYTGGTLNDGSIGQVTMAYHNERLWFSFPAGVSATNNRNLVFDPHEKWWGLSDIPAHAMTVFRPGNVDELVFAYATGTKDIGRYVGTVYTADDVGTRRFNLIGNPSFEVDTVGWSTVAPGWFVNPGAVISRTISVGSGLGDAFLNVTAANAGNDQMGIVYAITDTFLAGVPYTFSIRTAIDAPHFANGGAGWALRLGRAGGADNASATPTFVAPWEWYSVTWVPAVDFTGLVYAVLVNAAGVGNARSVAVDGAFVEQAATGITSNDDYFDGSLNGGGWLGTPHDSRSAKLTPGIGGTAISSLWQSGWFDYDTPAVKTIRESKVAGSGLVTVAMARDYRQSSAWTVQRSLSPSEVLWDGGENWDGGAIWGPSGSLQTKAIRKAIRGERFSLILSNATLNRGFKVNRFTTHVREVRVPSVVKVA